MATSGYTVAIGGLIRAFREERGMSGNALAKQAGIPQPYLWKIEQGDTDPPASTLKKIADALSIHPGELLPSLNRKRA